MRIPGWQSRRDTDGNSTGVNGVVSHALGYYMRTADSMDNSQETRLCQDDVGCTTGSVSGTVDDDTYISTQEGRGIICPSPAMAQR